MASRPRDLKTPFESSSIMPAPLSRAGSVASSRSQIPHSIERAVSSPILRTGTGIRQIQTLNSRLRSTTVVTLDTVTSAYTSSPPLLRRSYRPELSLRLPSGRSSTVGYEVSSEQDGLDSETLSEESNDAMSEIIMAIEMRYRGNQGSYLGCAYYVAMEEALYILEDVPMADVNLVETLLLHAQPTTVLISAKAPESLVRRLESGSQDVHGSRGDFPGAYILRNINSTDFRYDTGKNKLLDIHIGMVSPQSILFTTIVDDGMPEVEDPHRQGHRQAQLMRLATSVNLDSQLSIGCAGAVLGDIQRRKTAQYLPNDSDALAAFEVRSIEMFSLFNSMFVNADTLASLQIMQAEYHPNRLQRGPTGSHSGAKEGLSIYGLFSHLVATSQGKAKLRRMFLQPSTDINIIHERQQTLSLFLQTSNDGVLSDIRKDLRSIKDMKPLLLLLRKGIDSIGRKASGNNSVWAMLQRFAAYSLQLRESLRALAGAEAINIVQKAIRGIDTYQIRKVGELITETIDFEQSVERGRTAVKQGIDADLDERKRNYDGMEHFLSAVINKLRSGLPEWAKKYVQNCIFFPQLGFLTVVSINPQSGKGNYNGEGLSDSWECMFIAEGNAYYKNQQMKDMDEEFGDSYCMIIDREIEIIHQLAVAIIEREEAVIIASEVLGELDSLVALATLCGQNKWVAPVMTDTNIIQIRGGRHPLQELVAPSFIPNDCFMAGGMGRRVPEGATASSPRIANDLPESPSTIVVTGPNHSGKSIYLKQTAIIVYLAHIGCYVPAEYARIGLTDRILTRIATRESVARSESAFAIDLRQVAFAMNFATRRSLVIIDEFGKGTNTHDGAGLLTATINHFTGLGPERPKLLAATHYHEILDDNILAESTELAFAHMNVHIDLDAPTTEDQVTYLYQLTQGKSISSFGSRCAAMNGVDQAIVERAELIILQIAQHEDLEVACSNLSETEARKLKIAETIARAFLEEDIVQPSVTNPSSGSKDWYRSKLNEILSPNMPEM